MNAPSSPGLKPVIGRLASGEKLSEAEAEAAFGLIMEGEATPAQMAALLMAMRLRGETVAEITGAARAMRARMLAIEAPDGAIDTCGTGGDRSHLINISTLVGLTLAAQGIPVAKHGNRAVSSSSGSADVLEALGYPLEEKPELIAARLKKNNFAFFFAPLYHPAMKHAGPVRKEIGVRTVFNVLGPLANPAAAPLQLIGVYAQALILPMAETLKLLGLKAALVVHSEDGLDEISPLARTNYALLLNGKITQGTYTPPQQQYVPALDALRADSKEKSLALFKDVVAGQNAAGAYMTALNAAFAKKLFDAVKAGTPLADPAPTQDEIVAQFDLIQSGALGDVVKFT